MNLATSIIASQYPNAELRNVVPRVRYQNYNIANNVPTGPEFYGYQINGRLDVTLEQPSAAETLQEVLGDPIGSNRHFKIWFKKGSDVYLLLDLGYAPSDPPPEPYPQLPTVDDASGNTQYSPENILPPGPTTLTQP